MAKLVVHALVAATAIAMSVTTVSADETDGTLTSETTSTQVIAPVVDDTVQPETQPVVSGTAPVISDIDLGESVDNATTTQPAESSTITPTKSSAPSSSNETGKATSSSEFTTPTDDNQHKTTVVETETQPVVETTPASSTSQAVASSETQAPVASVASTSDDVVEKSHVAIVADRANADGNVTTVSQVASSAIRTPSATVNGETTAAVVQESHDTPIRQVVVQAHKLADDIVPKSVFELNWVPLVFAIVLSSLAAWLMAFTAINKRQRELENKILNH